MNPQERPSVAGHPAADVDDVYDAETTTTTTTTGPPPADRVSEESSAEQSSAVDRSLVAEAELPRLRSRWDDVQSAFVDDPRGCVQQADQLVSEVVEQLTAGFSRARARLEEQWSRGEDASTEDLRVALTRYREFFQRLLTV